MPSLDSDKVDRALRNKMKATRTASGDYYYEIFNDKGIVVGTTSISKGSKDDLSPGRVSQMSRQLNLGNAKNLVNLVSCTLSREEAIEIMEKNSQ